MKSRKGIIYLIVHDIQDRILVEKSKTFIIMSYLRNSYLDKFMMMPYQVHDILDHISVEKSLKFMIMFYTLSIL